MSQSDKVREPAVSLKKRVFSIPTLLSFGIATAFIFLLATRFNLNWGETWDNIRNMDARLYVLGFLAYYSSFLFRGLRWRLLARNAGADGSTDVKLPSVFHASQLIVIGWFVNSITWLRLGDAYRAYAFAEDSNQTFSWSLGTVFAERVIDMIIIAILLVASILLLAVSSSVVGLGYIAIAAFGMVLVLLTVLLAMKLYGARFARRFPKRLEEAYFRFHQGALGSFKQLPVLFLLGLTGWFLEIARLYFVIQALHLDASWFLISLVALGHAILSTVPTPGGVGAVEPGVTGLLLLGFERIDAVSIALLDRSITYVSVIAVGGIIFLVRQIGSAKRQRGKLVPAEDVAGGHNPAD